MCFLTVGQDEEQDGRDYYRDHTALKFKAALERV